MPNSQSMEICPEQKLHVQYEHNKHDMNMFQLYNTFNKDKEVLNKTSSNASEIFNEQGVSSKGTDMSDEFGSNDSSPVNTFIQEKITNALSILNADLLTEKHDSDEGEPIDLDSVWKYKAIEQIINELIEKCGNFTADKCVSVTPSTSDKLYQTDISFLERNSCKRKLEFIDCGSTSKSKLSHKSDAKGASNEHSLSSAEVFNSDYAKVVEEIFNSEDFAVMNNKDICWSPIPTHHGSGGMPLMYQEEEKGPDEIDEYKSLFDERALEDGQLNWSSNSCDSETVVQDQLVPLPHKPDEIEENDPLSEDVIKIVSSENNRDSLTASNSLISTGCFKNKLPENNLNHDCIQTSTSSSSECTLNLDYMLASTSSCNSNSPTTNYRRYLDYLVIERSLYHYSSDEGSD